MTRRAVRGLTLIELLVAMGVSTLIIAAAFALLSAQQRTFRAGSDERQLQEGGRVALDELATNLRMAGFGIDPSLAIDFGAQADSRQARAPSGTVVPSLGYQCPAGKEVSCRDSADGSDEIVFRSRDPDFGHRFTRVPSATTITIDGPIRADLQAGQILLVACYATPMTWAYVTVGRTVAADPAANEVKVELQAGNGATFPNQNDFLTGGSCYTAVAAPGADAATIDNAAKVFKVDTFRYYVATFSGRPYLMLDQGFAAPTVVAADVEDLQFVYVFPNAPAGLQIVGDVAGAALANAETDIDLAPVAGAPTFYSVVDGLERQSHHPGNIRLVRMSAVVRAPSSATEARFDTVPAAGNRPAKPGQPIYRRFLLETSVSTPNLDARAPYYPSWSAGVDALGKPLDALNVGGG